LDSSSAAAIFVTPTRLLFWPPRFRLRPESFSLAMQIKKMPTATIYGEWGKLFIYWMSPAVRQS
jgi:hypothetical protein